LTKEEKKLFKDTKNTGRGMLMSNNTSGDKAKRAVKVIRKALKENRMSSIKVWICWAYR
jgi:hypothetical protein